MSHRTTDELDAATSSVEVRCDPVTAFRLFTDDIGRWWRRGSMYWFDAERAVDLRFTPGVGGRLVEVHDEASGEGLELGAVTAWEPGQRLVFGWRVGADDGAGRTEVEVTFAEAPVGTRVTVEHRGWAGLAAEEQEQRAGYAAGWTELLGWYADLARGDR